MINADSVKLKVGHFSIDVTVNIADNEYFVLLGMTGSGKTLFLESLCGLRSIDNGTITINGIDVTSFEPKERFVGYVPQDGALFEHLTVAENIGFSLSVRKTDKTETRKIVEDITGKIGISHLLDRKIKGLSGGERQRVSLSRALASNPSVLIMDEPVSALDEYTREGVCRELKRIQRELKISVIHVCHSFEEAKLVGDRIGIMHGGRIVQTGKASELLSTPNDETVANILRLENLFTGVSDGKGTVAVNGSTIYAGNVAAGNISLLVRPWNISFGTDEVKKNCKNNISGIVSEIMSDGFASRIRMDGVLPLSGYLSSEMVAKMELKEGSAVTASFNADAVHFFNNKIL